MKSKRIFLLALLLLLAAAALAACGTGGSGGTTAHTTATIPPHTGAADAPLNDAELAALLSLVDYGKVSTAQLYYHQYYVGTYRSHEECESEIKDTLRNMEGVRSVLDSEAATALYIGLYARAVGDQYGYYFSPSDFDSYGDDLEGEYVGIGVSVVLTEGGYAEILNVFPSSPAEEAGLLPGDILVEVDGRDFALVGYQNAIDAIRGEAGTAVSLTVLRDGVRLTYTMARASVTEVTVESRMLEGNIGYIRIVSFNQQTYAQFVAAHRALAETGAESYIFDVRYNPGGTLDSVVAILEYILPDGPIVHLNYKIDELDATISSVNQLDSSYLVGKPSNKNHKIDEPIVVLANGGTASAGELFTSSLQDYGVATVLGERTYGKGVGQVSLTLASDGSGLVLTVFYYDPPTSPNYNGVGIAPDAEVLLSEEAAGKNLYKLPYEEDAQLKAAVHALLGQE